MLALAALLLAPAPFDVLEVDPVLGPYVQIHEAIAAAAEGDTIVVSNGSYEPFAIDGRSLSVIGVGAAVQVDGTVRVENLAVDQRVALVGLECIVPTSHSGTGLVLADNAGSVRVQGGTVRSWRGTGLQVHACSDVVVADCTLVGGVAATGVWPDKFMDAGEAADLDASNVAFFDCNLTAPGESLVLGQAGPAAVDSRASELLLVNSVLRGGDGGPGDGTVSIGGTLTCWDPGDGGPGLRARMGGAVRMQGGSFAGGLSGEPMYLCGSGYVLGPPLAIEVGTSSATFTSPTVDVACSAVAVGGTDLDVTVTSASAGQKILLQGTRPKRRSLPAFVGDLLVDAQPGAFVRVPLGAGPSVVASLPMPTLALGESFELHLQAVLFDGADVILGHPRTVTVLP